MAGLPFPKLPNGLTTEQKVAAVVLLFFGLGAIVIGFLSFGANLRRPFDVQLANAPKGFLLDSQKQSKEMEAMKTRDTDGDGLSDYDETYVYHTSPYLKDSDSDGIDDKTEIFAGTDPNCPQGKTCGGSVATDATAAPINSTTTMTAPTPPDDSLGLLNVAAGGGFKTEADVVAYLKTLNPTQQRQLLTQAGMTADKLAALTDEQLKTLFDQTVDEAAKQGQFKALIGTQAKPTTP